MTDWLRLTDWINETECLIKILVENNNHNNFQPRNQISFLPVYWKMVIIGCFNKLKHSLFYLPLYPWDYPKKCLFNMLLSTACLSLVKKLMKQELKPKGIF